MKFSIKSIIWGFISGAIMDLLVSIPGAWWQWREAQAMSRGGGSPDWGQYFEILQGWIGPVFLVALPLGILLHAWRSGWKEKN